MDVESSKFFHLKFFGITYFTAIIYLSGFVMLHNFDPILDKKDHPPEDKELYLIYLGHYWRLYKLSLSATLIATEPCTAL